MIDLHIHSKYSDGTYTVKEILEKAEELKLKYISITDHDTNLAYDELKNIDITKFYSGKVITGIELKTVYNDRLIEILGYNYNIEKMKNWLDNFYKTRQKCDIQTKYFNHLYDACLKLNIRLSPKQEIKWNPNRDWASVTIYNDLKKYKENENVVPKDMWNDFSCFTKKYCADKNSVLFIDKNGDYPKLEDAIRAVRDAGGIAIVAHIFIYKWAKDKEKLIQDIFENYDIDGFECYHNTFSEEQSNYLIEFCKKNNLLMSGGSDTHGDNKPGINLGTGRGNLNISEKIIENWINKQIGKP